MDTRTEDALERLALPNRANELRKLVDKQWDELKVGDIAGKDNEGIHMSAFVRILERAVGADLEGNLDNIRTAAEE